MFPGFTDGNKQNTDQIYEDNEKTTMQVNKPANKKLSLKYQQLASVEATK